ncbi:MAG: PKD domain-containing protein [Bacteroidota bacterium]
MKKNTIIFITVLIFALGIYVDTSAQISNGGTPFSTLYQLDDRYEKLSFLSPDMELIAAEDLINEAVNPNSPRRMGTSVIINRTMLNSGSWTVIPDVGKLWRLQINVDNALAMGVYYSKFFIPVGGQLFLYNHDKTQVIGAFTNENNPDENLFSTQFVEGDKIILEYFQPNDITENAIINVSEIAYAYRDIEFMHDQSRDSWWCMIDVACEEGDNWENQIKGVARMSIKIGGSYYWCSGSLINNTDNDRTPYFLSAAHCGEGSNSSDRNQWIFYFNYQASTCNGTNSGSNSMTGCQLKANDPSFADDGSDFYLVEFNNSIPSFYDVFYNGWNRTNSNDDAGSGVGIHHPAGDIKKISTYDTPLVSSTFWNGNPSHWKLNWAETLNGKSIMQGGSSGSPVFDSNGLIMGDLTGGYTSNSCSTPSPAYYGKIWYSWEENGNTSATRLKDWLDPGNTGMEKLPGISWQIIMPVSDFAANLTEVTQGDTVFFTDLSEPGVFEWDWSFENGEPSTSTEQNPWVIYTDTGYMDVSLTVTNGDGIDTEIKTEYIHVNQMVAPTTDFEADATNVLPGTSVHFTDLSSQDPIEWLWTLDGGSPSTSVLQSPTIRFNNEGVYTITLIATNLGGSDTLIKEDYIVVGGMAPEADFSASNTSIMQGETINFSDLSSGDPIEWEWEFEGGNPTTSTEQNPQNIEYPQGGAFNVSLSVTNAVGTNTKLIEDYILVDWVGIEDFSSLDDFRIYPNPGTGIFVIQFATADEHEVDIMVTNAEGQIISSEKITRNKGSFVLNLGNQPDGLYIVTINSGTNNVVKKLTILR